MTDKATTANGDRQTPSSTSRFPLGRLLATPGALRALDHLNVQPLALLSRHVRGDWGDLCEEDRASNELALVHGSRLMSSYRLPPPGSLAAQATIVWVITEWDRSVTTILLPSEY